MKKKPGNRHRQNSFNEQNGRGIQFAKRLNGQDLSEKEDHTKKMQKQPHKKAQKDHLAKF